MTHAARLEEWAAEESVLHRRDARAKIAALVVLLVAIGTTPPDHWRVLISYGLMLVGAVLIAGLPLAGLLGRAAAILPFPLTFALLSWWVNGNGNMAGALVARSYLSATGVLLLMGTTRFPELLRGLRAMGVPSMLVQVLQSLARYLQVIVDQGLRMRRAAQCRGGRGGNVEARRSLWNRAGGALAVLFGRSYSRAEAVHRAMLARGFRGEFIGLRPARFQGADWVFVVLAALCSAGVRLWLQ